MLQKKKLLLTQISLIFIFAYGIFLRVNEYLANRSLWLDEASLALNIIDKSFRQLITQPLDYNQAAPAGFLLLTKILVLLLGDSEFTFRLIPFISGIASLFLFYVFLKKNTSKSSMLIALGLFSFSYIMLRYATEFKPYSSDVMFALIVMIPGMSFLKDGLTLKKAVLWGSPARLSYGFHTRRSLC